MVCRSCQTLDLLDRVSGPSDRHKIAPGKRSAALFQDLAQHWFIKHPTIHFPTAYENLLIIRLIAYFLAMFFTCRHINARRKTPLLFSYLATLLYQSAVIDPVPAQSLRL